MKLNHLVVYLKHSIINQLNFNFTKEMTVEKISTGKRISVQDIQSVVLCYGSLSKVTGHPLEIWAGCTTSFGLQEKRALLQRPCQAAL